MEEDTWLRIDRSGFFPKENESEVEFILSYKELFSNSPKRQSASSTWLISATRRFFQFFHTIPSWVIPTISTKGLAPWELAGCWQYSSGRSYLQTKPKILEIPEEERQAILFHELVHAARARLHSLCFEELLAYEAMSSKKRSKMESLKRAISSFFLTPSETIFVLIWHLLLLVLSFFDAMSFTTYFSLIFFLWGALAVRGVWIKNTWKQAFQNIEHAFPGKGWIFSLRATDSDIVWLSSLDSKEVFDAIMNKASSDWRWKYLVVCTLS